MSATAAEEIDERIARGRELWASGDRAGAHAEFERAYRRDTGDARALSYFGMSTAVQLVNRQQGLLFCEEAVRKNNRSPELFVNQAHACLANKNKAAAIRALNRALDVDEEHEDALQMLGTLGVRRRPVIPFLSRGNPLNRALGRLRHRLRRR